MYSDTYIDVSALKRPTQGGRFDDRENPSIDTQVAFFLWWKGKWIIYCADRSQKLTCIGVIYINLRDNNAESEVISEASYTIVVLLVHA